MLVEWSRDVAGLYRSEYRYSTTSYYTTPQVLDLPSPICGAWTLAFNGDTRRLLLDWEFKDGVYDPLVVGGGSIVARSGTTRLWTIEVPAGNFPPSSCGTYRSNRLPNLHSQVTLTLELFHPAESRWNLPKLIVQTASHLIDPSPNNVRLYFPRTRRSLYANKTVLADASPYFKTLFEADFPKDGGIKTAQEADPAIIPPYTFDDSDEETDELLPAKDDSSDDTASFPHRTVVVTDTAYSTYYAVLIWLVTGKIIFAPSRAGREDADRETAAARRRFTITTSFTWTDAPVPPPVSAKSCYRLAHLLDFTDLASLALAEIRSQFDVNTVAYTLYGDVAAAYPEVQSAALDFAVDNWDKVAFAPATAEMETLADRGEADSAVAATAMKLAKRLAARIK